MSNPNAQGSGSANNMSQPESINPSYLRHSSYASVAAGASQARAAGRGIDSDMGQSHAPWIRTGGSGSGAQDQDDFFIPSYLKSSRYAEQLEREHKTRLAEKSRSRSTSNPPSATRASSNQNAGSGVRRMSMHRGLAHDVIEHAPKPVHAEDVPPLPSKWNLMDRNTSLDIYNNGLDVKFSGPPRGHDEAAVVRADHPMPKSGGIYYYEIQVLSKGREGRLVSFGFCTQKVTLSRLPGWEPESWAYHSDDGQIFNTSQHGRAYGPKYGPQDTVGCGVNFRTGTAFFTRNGVNIGPAFKDIRRDQLFPCVGMKKPGEFIRANFGASPFIFDIDSMIHAEKMIVMQDIRNADVDNLYPPLSETPLIQKLIGQYLYHEGYVGSATAFAKEVRQENAALQGGADADEEMQPEDTDASIRHEIRTAVLRGDIEGAMELTDEHYPDVLRKNELISFRLRCRKFVEMFRTRMGENTEPRRGRRRLDKGKAPMDMSDSRMDLDDDPNALPDGGAAGDMDTEEDQMDLPDDEDDEDDDDEGDMQRDDEEDSDDEDEEASGDEHAGGGGQAELSDLDLIVYGRELTEQFSGNSREEIRDELQAIVGLMAYPDPKDGPLKELLEERGRVPIAEQLNSAILVSLGKSPSAALERIIQQSEVMLRELGDEGGPGAFINLRRDFLESQEWMHD